MKNIKLKIVDSIGLHIEPASIASKLAKKYESEIFIEYEGKKASMKSLMAIASLAVSTGSEIEITIDGKDEEEALNDIIKTLKETNIAICL